MSKYTTHIKGDFYSTLSHLHRSILDASSTSSFEDGAEFEIDGVKCVTRVYERYSFMGGNRCSMSLTLCGKDGDVNVTAITSGGSQAMLFKINTIGEEAFLQTLIDAVQRL